MVSWFGGGGGCGSRAGDWRVGGVTAAAVAAVAAAAVFWVPEVDIAPCFVMLLTSCILITTGLLVRENGLRFAVQVEGRSRWENVGRGSCPIVQLEGSVEPCTLLVDAKLSVTDP
jgi:hypothetical protein